MRLQMLAFMSLFLIRSMALAQVGPPDVSFTSEETRSLTDPEAQALKAGLKWNPSMATLTKGGSAASSLVDASGRALLQVVVTWERTVPPNPNVRNSSAYNPAHAEFTIRMKNLSTCTSDVSAELKNPEMSGVSISSITWFGWVNLKEPGAGAETVAKGTHVINQSQSTLQFVPLAPDSSVSMCRTGKRDEEEEKKKQQQEENAAASGKDQKEETHSGGGFGSTLLSGLAVASGVLAYSAIQSSGDEDGSGTADFLGSCDFRGSSVVDTCYQYEVNNLPEDQLGSIESDYQSGCAQSGGSFRSGSRCPGNYLCGCRCAGSQGSVSGSTTVYFYEENALFTCGLARQECTPPCSPI